MLSHPLRARLLTSWIAGFFVRRMRARHADMQRVVGLSGHHERRPHHPGVEAGSDSHALIEDVAQFACEGFGLARVSELATHEAAVMAGEHRRLLTK